MKKNLRHSARIQMICRADFVMSPTLSSYALIMWKVVAKGTGKKWGEVVASMNGFPIITIRRDFNYYV